MSQPVDAGVAQVVTDLAVDQHAAGWAVTVLSPDGPLAGRIQGAGIPWAGWDAVRVPGSSTVAESRSLGRLLASMRPDIVHLHSSKAGLAGRLALRGRSRTVFQPHAWSFAAAGGAQAQAALAWERAAARWTDLRLHCSAEEAQEGADRGIGGASRVVPNGVDLGRFHADGQRRSSARAALGVHAGCRVAVCVGRLTRQKGQDVAVAAWPGVRRHVPGAVLLLVGDGPEMQRLRSAAGPGVRFLGERADVPDILAAADLAVLPSRWEGLALALLEAMASGRTVVATAVAGSASTVLGGDLSPAGAVVGVDDPHALAAAVVERLTDPDLLVAEGAAGRMRVERDHSLQLATGRVRDAYRDVIDEPLGTGRRMRRSLPR